MQDVRTSEKRGWVRLVHFQFGQKQDHNTARVLNFTSELFNRLMHQKVIKMQVKCETQESTDAGLTSDTSLGYIVVTVFAAVLLATSGLATALTDSWCTHKACSNNTYFTVNN